MSQENPFRCLTNRVLSGRLFSLSKKLRLREGVFYNRPGNSVSEADDPSAYYLLGEVERRLARFGRAMCQPLLGKEKLDYITKYAQSFYKSLAHLRTGFFRFPEGEF